MATPRRRRFREKIRISVIGRAAADFVNLRRKIARALQGAAMSPIAVYEFGGWKAAAPSAE
jgi:hypothetical protein